MIRKGLRWFVFLALCGVVGWLGSLREEAAARARVPADEKLDAADRVVYYVTESERGPRFRLSGTEEWLRVVSHVVLPPGSIYDPDREIEYGLRLSIHTPTGTSLWEREVYTTTRQSKWHPEDPVHGIENTFGQEPGEQVTDDRLLRIRLPPGLPVGAELSLRLSADPGFVGLVRAYARRELEPVELALRELSLSPAEAARLVENLSIMPWRALSGEERFARLRYRWERLAALGRGGGDYTTRVVYFTGYRDPGTEPPLVEGTHLEPRHSAAWNVMGPGVMSGVVAFADPEVGDTEGHLEASMLSASGAEISRLVTLSEIEGQRLLELRIPSGLHTVRLASDRPVWVAMQGRREDGQAIVFGEERAGEDASGVLFPEYRYLPLVRVGPALGSAVFSVEGPRDDLSRVFRIDARAVVSGDDEVVVAPLVVQFFDDRGRLLARSEWSGTQGRPSPFEVVVDADEGFEHRVSEPSTFRVIAPVGAVTAVFSSESEHAIAAFALLPGEVPQSAIPPYGTVALTDVRWRYAPVSDRRYFALRPIIDAGGEWQGRRVLLRGQVRLETEVDGPETTREPPQIAQSYRSLAPQGGGRRHAVLQRVESIVHPKAGIEEHGYTKLASGRTIEMDADKGGVGPPRIRYRRSGSSGSSTIRLRVQDERTELRTHSSRGVKRLAAVEGDVLRIRVEPGFEGELFVDRLPISGGDPVFHRRTLYELNPDGLTLVVGHPVGGGRVASDATVLNVVVVWRGGRDDGPTLEAVLDRGRPSRRTGVPVRQITLGTRRFGLGEAAEPTELTFLDADHDGPWWQERFGVVIGPDVKAGQHRVFLRLVEGRGRVYSRFFVAGQTRVREGAHQWERLRDAEEDPL